MTKTTAPLDSEDSDDSNGLGLEARGVLGAEGKTGGWGLLSRVSWKAGKWGLLSRVFLAARGVRRARGRDCWIQKTVTVPTS